MSITDYVYFENSSSNPYLIRRIEELNKVRLEHVIFYCHNFLYKISYYFFFFNACRIVYFLFFLSCLFVHELFLTSMTYNVNISAYIMNLVCHYSYSLESD